MNTYTFAADLLIKYEGYNPTAVWDVNAYRIGYGSSTITFNDGSYRTVKQYDTTTKENANKDLARRIPEFEKRILNYIDNYGVTNKMWNDLPDPAKVGLISFAYNYGNIVKKAIREAIKTGDVDKIADALLSSTLNDMKTTPYYNGLQKRRKAEAELIRSQKKKFKELKILKLSVPFLLMGGLLWYFRTDVQKELKKWVNF
jgi:GH24 family phage-related lysozyme (muramidase)